MYDGIDRKTEYLVSELWILAWNASVQRAEIFKEGAWKNERERIGKFKQQVIDYLKKKIVPQYRETVEEHKHCENIRNLINCANTIDPSLLREAEYKYGVAQKLLNLALKYYWCLGHIKEPPHCPIDKIVIDRTTCKGSLSWTKMRTEKEYLKVISAIRAEAEKKNCSIAQWELDNYERREPKPYRGRRC